MGTSRNANSNVANARSLGVDPKEPIAPPRSVLLWIDNQSKSSKPFLPRRLAPRFRVGFILNLGERKGLNASVMFSVVPCLLEERENHSVPIEVLRDYFETALIDGGVIVEPSDLRLLMALGTLQFDNASEPSWRNRSKTLPDGSLLIEAVKTGRMFLKEDKKIVQLGSPIKAELGWRESSSGSLVPAISTLPKHAIILATSYPYCYMLKTSNTIGLIEDADLKTDIFSWLSCPPVAKDIGVIFRSALQSARLPSTGLESFKTTAEEAQGELDTRLPKVNLVISREHVVKPTLKKGRLRSNFHLNSFFPSDDYIGLSDFEDRDLEDYDLDSDICGEMGVTDRANSSLDFRILDNKVIIDAGALKNGPENNRKTAQTNLTLYPEFIYGETRVRHEMEGTYFSQGDPNAALILRAPAFEKETIERLKNLGLTYTAPKKVIKDDTSQELGYFHLASSTSLNDLTNWLNFVEKLRLEESKGRWTLEFRPMDCLLIKKPEEMFLEIQEFKAKQEYRTGEDQTGEDQTTEQHGNDERQDNPDSETDELYGSSSDIHWFQGNLGIIINGKRHDLTPILTSLMESKTQLFSRITASNKREVIFEVDNQLISLEGDRLDQITSTLSELSSARKRSKEIKLTDFAALELQEALNQHIGTWYTAEGITDLKRRIGNLSRRSALSEPLGFCGALREYQKDGFSWMSSLVDGNLSGILADDMGLGKTIQLIALILREHQEGRTGPNLVVCPKSVAPNWVAEISRFASNLKVHPLIGRDRASTIDELPQADVYITTYPLIPRDIEVIKQIPLNLAIFDEAQYIKNPLTKTYSSCLRLRARTKIPVSGTPIENHLGELWAHFNLMMPGFLSSRTAFKKAYRDPIEKLNSEEVRLRLATRIKPFLMRRTKSDVLIELPPINHIVHRCQFEKDQRDLYETVRQMTEKVVRDALKKKGAGRAHIEFLDALLKLRQVCCDPKLVKLSAARKVKESAKLDALMELVDTSMAEGRSIIIFSQFTTMLSIIEDKLQKQRYRYAILTGETEDRVTPVKLFQEAQVPIILMSLKAGGVGINLTRADTVILYDPWWNPSVEEQAISRAHRMGQKSSVFVYRLIVEGTVEEKILELQDKKRDLVTQMLNNGDKPTELTAELVDVLFGPMDMEMAA